MKTFTVNIAVLWLIVNSLGAFSPFCGFISVNIDQALAQQDDAPERRPGDKRRGPPPEAVAACEVQNVGEVCSFESPRGDLILGMCENTRAGVMACVPEGGPPGGPGGERPADSE